jgi:uncharacterized membrane protein YjfL (UPF0719 family)
MSVELFMHCVFVFLVASVLLYVGQQLLGFVWKLNMSHQLTVSDNPAVILFSVGKLFAQILLMSALVFGFSTGLLNDIVFVLSRYLAGIFMLTLSTWICINYIWFRGENFKENLENRNVASAVLSIAVLVSISMSFLWKARMYSDDFILYAVHILAASVGILSVNAIVKFFTSQREWTELKSGNVAVAIDKLGSIVALSLVWIAFSASFDSVTALPQWWRSLPALGGLFVLGSARVVFEFIWTPHSKMSVELLEDKNWSLALLGAVLQIGIVSLFCLSML